MSGTLIDGGATSYTSLLADLQTANGETTPGVYTIKVSGTISLSAALPAIDLAPGVTLDIVGINGGTLDGGNSAPGLFVYKGGVSIDDLIISDAKAQGGAGSAPGGGGGAGLGGALFVGSQATVTLDKVNFTGDAALGGNGGAGGPTGAAGMGGHGRTAGGTSYAGVGAHAGLTQAGFGGGGGGASVHAPTGKGGFGGGDGAIGHTTHVSHAHSVTSHHVVTYTYHTPSGVHHGSNSFTTKHVIETVTTHKFIGAGGGGLGAGGDVFVQSGGRLSVLGGTLGSGTVQGGTGANTGGDFGSGIFLQGNEILTLAPSTGETLAIHGTIADEKGSLPGISSNSGTITIDGAGTVELYAANSFAGGVQLMNGTLILEAGGAAGSGNITFDNAGTTHGILAFTVADTPTNLVAGFGTGDTIDITDLLESSISKQFTPDGKGGGALMLIGTQIGSGVSETLTVSFTDYAGPFSYSPDTGGGTVASSSLCFLHNTHIATPTGETAVQNLAIGDLVLTQRGEPMPIQWIGIGSVLATRGRRNAATPVIVRKGALAPNVPNRDLRLTKGHALHLDGVLVPVECLVNHRSIVWDDRAQEVSLYHIELPAHDVMLANGAPAESYRDDGNRWLFRNANTGWDLPPQETCAPLLMGGPKVDALWHRLLQRDGARPGLPTTDEPDLHLIVDGSRLDAEYSDRNVHAFRLRRRPETVRLVSRAAAPQELGLARDPRVLGVAIRQLRLWQGRSLRVMEAADTGLAAGFHRFETAGGIRWTDGDAAVSMELFDGFDGAMDLHVVIGATARYHLDDAVMAGLPLPKAA